MGRPGWKTTEFWLSALASIVGLLMASGIVGDGSIVAQALGMIATALASAGYAGSRGLTKGSEAKANAIRSLPEKP